MAKLGATIFARDELRDRLMNPAPGANGQPGMAAPDVALPVVTYENKITFHLNGETVDLIPIRKAHTDGDTMVYFHNANIIMTGDFYRSIGYPNIDRVNGGSLDGMIEGLAEVIALAGPNTKIIPGHGPIVDRNAVIAHRDMILGVRDQVAKLMKEGKSADEVSRRIVTADLRRKGRAGRAERGQDGGPVRRAGLRGTETGHVASSRICIRYDLPAARASAWGGFQLLCQYRNPAAEACAT